jgi:hypothetical protein
MSMMVRAVAAATVLGLSLGGGAVVAQNNSGVGVESSTTLITLGTGGGPLPRKDRAQSSNLLIVTPSDIGQMAAKARVKAVVMTHLGPTPDPNDDYQRYVVEAKKYYSGPIVVAKDLMKF